MLHCSRVPEWTLLLPPPPEPPPPAMLERFLRRQSHNSRFGILAPECVSLYTIFFHKFLSLFPFISDYALPH